MMGLRRILLQACVAHERACKFLVAASSGPHEPMICEMRGASVGNSILPNDSQGVTGDHNTLKLEPN